MRVLSVVLLGLTLQGCVTYELEEEFWLRVDGSGSVNVTGRPELWSLLKGVPLGSDPLSSVRHVFEESGLLVQRVRLVTRRGKDYLFVTADFRDLNRISGTPAFKDLKVSLLPKGERLDLEGVWSAASSPGVVVKDQAGLMAVRWHLPSKIYFHKNAFGGVGRGNILSWRQEVASALKGEQLVLGAELDKRSILLSTVTLFGGAILAAFLFLGGAVYFVARRGRAMGAGP